MKIDRKTWDEYITRLSRINKRAANEMQAYLEKLATEGGNRREEQIIERAFGLATKYGEASGAAACDFYDKIAAGTGHNVPPANPADTATFAETVKAIRGTIKNQSEAQVPSTVGRLVKQCSADTMLQNAARDGAEFAWIPSGDTCAFCLTLASRGWQSISKKAVRNGHAEHIHANCNCEYCVRFSEFETVEGYDPEKYRKMYEDAEGSTPQEKINAMRRELGAEKKDQINKELYAKREKEHLWRGHDVFKEYLKDATPRRGNIDYDKGFDPEARQKEVETAKIVFNQLGGDFILKKEKGDQKNPDYEWNGRLWDLKSITSEKAANSAIKKGMQQIARNPGGIMLNLWDRDFSLSELKGIIDLRMTWYPDKSADIMVISKGKILRIFRY